MSEGRSILEHMFDDGCERGDPAALAAVAAAHARTLGAASASRLESAPDRGAALVDLLTALSSLTAAAEALAARTCVELDRVRRAEEAERGVRAARRGQGVAAEIALARRESGYRGRSFLQLSTTLCTEMPHTLAALAGGRLTPWRAMLLVRESACLEPPDRERLDRDLCADTAVLAGCGDRGVAAAAKRWACEVDPAAVVAHQARAESERRVSLRPAPDTMTYLTALLPVAQGVAAFAALSRRADAARAAGEGRSRGQVMADALVAAVTGLPEGAAPPVLVNLVMTDRALLGGADDPASVLGAGPVPAAHARDLVGRAGERNGPGAWVRRLYVAPTTGALVGMESRSRAVPTKLAELIRIRDGDRCRIPWCDAPARHIDHATSVAEGGATTASNLQSLCEAHNYAKQAPGWRAGTAPPTSAPASSAEGTVHTIHTRTPSGHRYSGAAPPLPGAPRERGRDPAADVPSSTPEPSPGERVLAALLGRAA